jgi:hypothetical protein
MVLVGETVLCEIALCVNLLVKTKKHYVSASIPWKHKTLDSKVTF